MDLMPSDLIEPVIFSLPPEVMLSIFSFCSGLELVSSVQFVCARWHKLINSDPYWSKRAFVIKDRELGQNFVRLISHAPFLRSISIMNCSLSIDVISVLNEYCPSLSILEVSAHRCYDLRNLKTLLNLVQVDLCMDWEDRQCIQLLELPSIGTLEKVILRKFSFNETIAVHLLRNCPRLQHLVLTKLDSVEKYITMRDLDALCSFSHSLKTVYIFGEKFLAKDTLNAVGEFKTLLHTVLKPTNFTQDDFMRSLFLEPSQLLETLDLGYACCVSDSLIQAVAVSCPNLRNLILTRCDIGDNGFRSILSFLSKLEKLNLHGTHVTSTMFHDLPSSLPKLTDLGLRACRRIQHDTLHSLIHLMPDLLIELPRSGYLTGFKAKGRVSPFISFRNELK